MKASAFYSFVIKQCVKIQHSHYLTNKTSLFSTHSKLYMGMNQAHIVKYHATILYHQL